MRKKTYCEENKRKIVNKPFSELKLLGIKSQPLFSDEKHRIRRFTRSLFLFLSDRGNSFPFVFRTEWKGDLKKERGEKERLPFPPSLWTTEKIVHINSKASNNSDRNIMTML